jgi:hypothetical protein
VRAERPLRKNVLFTPSGLVHGSSVTCFLYLLCFGAGGFIETLPDTTPQGIAM